MLNNNSIQILQSITSITNSALISYPVTTITNANKDVLGNIDFSAIDPDGWDEFGIFDLNSFLGALSVLDEPNITMENRVILAEDSDSSISFLTATPSAVSDYITDPDNITTTVAAPSVVEVPIDTVLITKIRKGVNVFKTLKDLFIVKNDEGVFLRTGNKESFTRNDNSYKVKLAPSVNTGNNFEVAIPVENFLSLPSMDFTLKVKYNAQYDAYRITAENAIFQFVLSIKF